MLSSCGVLAYSAAGRPGVLSGVSAYTISHAKGPFLAPWVQFLIPRIPRLEYARPGGHSALGRTSPDS